VGEDGKPVVYKKAKLGDNNKMYYNEEVRGAGWGCRQRRCCCSRVATTLQAASTSVTVVWY